MDLIPHILLIFLCLCTADQYTERKVLIKDLSVQCGTDIVPLFHVTATKHGNHRDVIHYLVTTWTRPTVLIKHTMRPTSLILNTTNICNQTLLPAFLFKDVTGETTAELSGVMISQVFQYIDRYDDITLHQHGHRDKDVLPYFTWTSTVVGKEKVVFEGIDHNSTNATLRFTLEFHTAHGQGLKPPKNPINANLTEFRLELINLPAYYKQTRYAAEVTFFTTAISSMANNMADAGHTTTQYIDDEYTPGIFEIWAVNFLQELSRIRRTYVTWKPVSYHSHHCVRSDQGLVKKFLKRADGEYTKLDNPLPQYEGEVPCGLVSGMNAKNYQMFVTFGIPKDGFYNGHPYLSWSGMVGSGTPPQDTMSTKLILTIAIGLGTPGVVIIIGIIFLLMKKMHSSSEITYDEIQ